SLPESGGQTSWRRCRAASDAPGYIGQSDAFPGFDGASDGDHGPHGSHAIIDSRPLPGRAVQDRVGETLDLPLVGVRVLAQRPAKLPVAHREAFDQGRLVK